MKQTVASVTALGTILMLSACQTSSPRTSTAPQRSNAALQANQPVAAEASNYELVFTTYLVEAREIDIVTKAVRAALIGRQWTNIKVEGNVVYAELDHHNVEAKVKLVCSKDSVEMLSDSYQANTDRGSKRGTVTRQRRYTPERWLRNIELDLKHNIMMY